MSSPPIVTRTVADSLEAVNARGKRVVAAVSGGVDSVVLLHALAGLARTFDVALSALHVHHGLSPYAKRWAQFCAQLCESMRVPCSVVQVKVDRRRKLGLEAAARAARYAAFRGCDADIIALAHHQDDQAETVLLQLLRGAGVRGLSAMPRARRLPGSNLKLLRPLLSVTRAQILAYAHAAGLEWVEDESNLDPAIDRNFLRARIMPMLVERFPGCSATLARAADNAADAARLADDLGELDAKQVLVDDGVDTSTLARLTLPRARNLLRCLIEREGFAAPSRERLDEALRQVLHARADAKVQVDLGEAVVRRHRGRLYLGPVCMLPSNWEISWQGQSRVELPAGLGCVQFEPTLGVGLSLERMRAPTVIRPRLGGERIRLAHRGGSRTLKNLLQEAGIPQWRRDSLPLLFSAGELVWVPHIGADVRYRARSDEAGVLPRWVSSEGY